MVTRCNYSVVDAMRQDDPQLYASDPSKDDSTVSLRLSKDLLHSHNWNKWINLIFKFLNFYFLVFCYWFCRWQDLLAEGVLKRMRRKRTQQFVHLNAAKAKEIKFRHRHHRHRHFHFSSPLEFSAFAAPECGGETDYTTSSTLTCICYSLQYTVCWMCLCQHPVCIF